MMITMAIKLIIGFRGNKECFPHFLWFRCVYMQNLPAVGTVEVLPLSAVGYCK